MGQIVFPQVCRSIKSEIFQIFIIKIDTKAQPLFPCCTYFSNCECQSKSLLGLIVLWSIYCSFRFHCITVFGYKSFMRIQSMCAYAFLCVHTRAHIHAYAHESIHWLSNWLNRLRKIFVAAFLCSSKQHSIAFGWFVILTYWNLKKSNRSPSAHSAVSCVAWKNRIRISYATGMVSFKQ